MSDFKTMKVKGYWMGTNGGMSVLYDGVGCHPATQSELVFWMEITALREQVRRRDKALKEIMDRSAEHPSFDPELTMDESIEMGGDTCDWWMVHDIARTAIREARGRPNEC